MATGEDAAAAGMDLVPGGTMANTIDDELNKTRDYVATIPAAKGHKHSGADITSGTVPAARLPTTQTINRINNTGTYTEFENDIRTLADVRVVGHVIVPNAVAASSGYVTAYINIDGRLSKGASSRRYKKNIRHARLAGDVLAVPLREFQLRARDADTVYHVGHIAEELAELDATARFVNVDADGNPESYDEIAWLKAAVHQLAQRVIALEAR